MLDLLLQALVLRSCAWRSKVSMTPSRPFAGSSFPPFDRQPRLRWRQS
jgi:hypothetical protein